jgi:immunity protein 8 of polymorphic toxin system
MRASLRQFHSPDVEDLEAFAPGPADFGFLLQMIVGPADSEGDESFDIVVCTPGWFASRLGDTPISGRDYLFVREYEFPVLEAYLQQLVDGLEAPTWADLAAQLAKFTRWEFDDYREGPDEPDEPPSQPPG